MEGRIIYIAGYGRSGSTLLSILLDNVASVVGVGELAGLSKFVAAGAPVCSCGVAYDACPVWSQVLRRCEGAVRSLERMERVRHRMESWSGRLLWWHREDVRDAYRRSMTQLLEAVFDVTGADVIVDGSKSAFSTMWRARLLADVLGADVFVVHLVRRPSQVMTSCRKGRNVDLERGKSGRAGVLGATVGLGGWFAANLAARLIRGTCPADRSTVVRYEELVASPGGVVRRLCEEAGIDLGDEAFSIRDGAPFAVGHIVGANRMARDHDAIRVRESASGSAPAGWLEKVVAATVESRLLRMVTGEP